ncbi:hypothetical protein [Neochlamydia sp. EPS4]|uniref:hypothetical protein n=1 Tax=Neochlamydia sp. EPS4 TaxID=1478175 RepID=UPI0012BA6899
MHALDKSQATYQREGFTQIIKDKFIGKNLGAPSCGHNASIIIVQMSWTMANNLTIEPIKKIILFNGGTEAWLEATFIVADAPLHFPSKI